MAQLKSSNPIGVFDSGLGGLTVVREIRRMMPHEDIIYFGDSARLPYGTKSKRQIIQFSLQNALFLLQKKVKALVIACNTSSANAYYMLRRSLPISVIDVIYPASLDACTYTQNGRVGVLGTSATVRSQAYQREIAKINKNVHVYTAKCPLFVPLVEEGWLDDTVTREVVARYVAPLKKKRIDTLILGCTHYPLLKKVIAEEMGKQVTIVDSGPSTASILKRLLEKYDLVNHTERSGKLKIFVSDLSPHFVHIGEQFLKQPLGHVSIVKM